MPRSLVAPPKAVQPDWKPASKKGAPCQEQEAASPRESIRTCLLNLPPMSLLPCGSEGLLRGLGSLGLQPALAGDAAAKLWPLSSSEPRMSVTCHSSFPCPWAGEGHARRAHGDATAVAAARHWTSAYRKWDKSLGCRDTLRGMGMSTCRCWLKTAMAASCRGEAIASGLPSETALHLEGFVLRLESSSSASGQQRACSACCGARPGNLRAYR